MSMIYLDHAATTPVRPEVLEEMLPYLKEMYGNPSGLCQRSMEAAKAVETARKRVADSLGCEPEEIYFTSGGTEADNWALKSSARMAKNRGVGSVHIINSQVEHHAVLHACEALERAGAAVTCLPVDERGRVSPVELERAIRPDTALISIMYANNEVGTIQPVREIGAIARSHHICFHTDAVQAYGHLPISVNELASICSAPAGINAARRRGSVFSISGREPICRRLWTGERRRGAGAPAQKCGGNHRSWEGGTAFAKRDAGNRKKDGGHAGPSDRASSERNTFRPVSTEAGVTAWQGTAASVFSLWKERRFCSFWMKRESAPPPVLPAAPAPDILPMYSPPWDCRTMWPGEPSA